MSKEGLIAGGLIAGGLLIGGLAVASGSVLQYKTVYDYTGEVVESIKIEYAEPVRIKRVRVRGELVFPEGGSEKLFRDYHCTSIFLRLVATQITQSGENITSLMFYGENKEPTLSVVSRFDTGMKFIHKTQENIPVKDLEVYLECGTYGKFKIRNLYVEVYTDKKVGSIANKNTGLPEETCEKEVSFGNGECIVTLDKEYKIKSGSQVMVDINTEMKGIHSGKTYSEGNFVVRFLDNNNLEIWRKSGTINGSVSLMWDVDTDLTIKSIQVSVVGVGNGSIGGIGITSTELLKISGKIKIIVVKEE